MIRKALSSDFKGGDKIVEILEALGTAKEEKLELYLKKLHQVPSPKTVIKFLHGQGYVYNNLSNGYTYASLGSKLSAFSDVAFDLFLSLAETPFDGMDKAKFPVDLQFYIGKKIYHLINFGEQGIEKLKYRFMLPKELTESKDVIPIIVSINNHQRNLNILKENANLLPAQSYIIAKATIAGDCEIELVKHGPGEL